MSEDLFSEFDTATAAEWKAKVIQDLKGKDYEKSLQWTSPGGILSDPFYSSNDLKALERKYADHDLSSLTKGRSARWLIIEKIIVRNEIIYPVSRPITFLSPHIIMLS